MAFETGTFTNSHELIHKMIGFLANIGWRKHAILKSDENDQDGYDIVFYSTGTKDDKDIYIRLAAGLGDRWTTMGDIQFPYDDGYTEFVNGLAYQYFPENGTTGDDGYSELGVYGPILYNSDGTNGNIYEYNMFNFGNFNANRNILLFTGSDLSTSYYANIGWPIGFDGRNKIYQSGGSSFFFSLDVFDNSYINEYRSGSAWINPYTPYIRNRYGDEFMYGNIAGSTAGQKTLRYSPTARKYLYLADPPFSISGTGWYGAAVSGTKRKKFLNGQPMHHLLYWMAGRDASNGSNRWAYFDVENEEWSTLITPALPFTAGTNSYRPDIVFAPKEATGYDNDRVYMLRGSGGTEFVSIAIGDDGYVAEDSFTSHANTPYSQNYGQKIFFIGKAIFMTPGIVATPYEQLYRWALPNTPSGVGSWEILNDTFFDSVHDNWGPVFGVHYHLCNRARITENEENTYWAFADKDRIVIVIKNASGNYNYIYTGLYESYLDDTTATLINDTPAGSYHLKVSDVNLFTIGNKYLIVDATGSGKIVVGEDKTTRIMAPSQIITVVDKIDTNTLVVSKLANSYSAGSKIAEDPLPLMVRVHSVEKAQTLNNISLDRTDDFSDPPFQTYRIRPVVDSTITQAGDINGRTDETLIFPIILYQDGATDMIGNEARGQLKGVYAVGTDIASEADITVGSDTYIAFDIEESGETRRIVVGPKR